ncbi:DUF106 domain-containing protein [Candidatus Woesearchaeota archaeon]|nr:DUF106 domain-containing protein [Candidatus Woesearchaeota archaeon]
MGALDFMNVLLSLPPALAILVISAAVSLMTTVVYKYTTNQKLLKEIKDDVKRIQSEIKTIKDPSQAAQLQKEMMKRSMQQFSSSTKSMLITLVPLFLVFGWMQAHLAYAPLSPGDEFTTTVQFAKGAGGNITLNVSDGLELLSQPTQGISENVVSWRVKGVEKGSHQLKYGYGNELYSLNALLTDGFRYEKPILSKASGFLGSPNGSIKKDSVIERISVGMQPLQPLGGLSIIGWKPGWLATYIVFSMVFSLLVRKWLKVY